MIRSRLLRVALFCLLAAPVAMPLAAGVPSGIVNTATISSTTNDPDPSSNASTAVTAVALPVITVPTMSPLGLALLAAALGGGALVLVRRRRTLG